MYRSLGPGAVGVRLPWMECLPLARAGGFEGIEVSIDPAVPAAAVREALEGQNLRPGGTGLPLNFRDDGAKFEQGLAALPGIAKRAAEIGVTRFSTWILSFSDSRPYKENFRFHAERLGRAARVLAEHGGRLGLEFLGPKTIRVGHKYPFVRTMEQMLELCEACGPNAGLLLDAWHWYTSLGTVEDILALESKQVVHVHINDAPAGVPLDQQKDNVRDLPGETGVIDLAGFLGALRKIGYDGPVMPEPFKKDLASLPPADAVRRAGEAMARVWTPSRGAAKP